MRRVRRGARAWCGAEREGCARVAGPDRRVSYNGQVSLHARGHRGVGQRRDRADSQGAKRTSEIDRAVVNAVS